MKAKWKVIDFATIAQIGGSSIAMANAYSNGNNLVQTAAALSLTGAIVTTRNKIRKIVRIYLIILWHMPILLIKMGREKSWLNSLFNQDFNKY